MGKTGIKFINLYSGKEFVYPKWLLKIIVHVEFLTFGLEKTLHK